MTSGDTSVTRYLFTSREYDADTGLQYNRARWYDAEVGKWVSEGPLGFAAGDGNLARYVGNDVVVSVEPSGREGFILPSALPGSTVTPEQDVAMMKTQTAAAVNAWAQAFQSAAFGALGSGAEPLQVTEDHKRSYEIELSGWKLSGSSRLAD